MAGKQPPKKPPARNKAAAKKKSSLKAVPVKKKAEVQKIEPKGPKLSIHNGDDIHVVALERVVAYAYKDGELPEGIKRGIIATWLEETYKTEDYDDLDWP